jgi:hypothetical protein
MGAVFDVMVGVLVGCLVWSKESVAAASKQSNHGDEERSFAWWPSEAVCLSYADYVALV